NSLLAVRDINHKYIVVEKGRKGMRKNIIKSVSVVMLSLVMMIVSAMNAQASDIHESKIGLGINSEEGEIEPQYVISCTSPSGKHLMKGRGTGRAYYGAYPSKDLRIVGQGSQCSYCYLALVTENNPFWGTTTCWGNYAYYNPHCEVGTINMWTTSFGYSSSNGDAFVRGFQFD
ncbi:MAG: hypothetical protein Q4C52_11765, partial [Eubacteriales bacterium]|nr:hypothetical protein [Eubacteriales bacterium]